MKRILIRRGLLRRGGLTLLELMLALALSTLVFMAIAMAIDVNLTAFNKRTADIEQAQLARAVLRLIADDLRGAIEESAADFSGVDASAMTGDLDEMVGEELGITDALFAEDEEVDTESNTEDIESQALLPAKLGLYGNQFQLQVDVSRLPRPDEYFASMSVQDEAGYVEIPSDIKSVAYYVQAGDDQALPAAGLYGPSATANGMVESGLVRRALDRSVTQYATEMGDTTMLSMAGEVVAPEISSIEFMYFDGIEWLTEWDSELMEALPMAVKVLISIRNPQETGTETPLLGALSGVGAGPEGDMVFEQVIALPMAKPAPEETSELSELGL